MRCDLRWETGDRKFWNNYSEELSKKLNLPTNFENAHNSNQVVNIFNQSLEKDIGINCDKLKFAQNKEIIKSKTYLLKVNELQRDTLNQWFHNSMKAYNYAVDYQENYGKIVMKDYVNTVMEEKVRTDNSIIISKEKKNKDSYILAKEIFDNQLNNSVGNRDKNISEIKKSLSNYTIYTPYDVIRETVREFYNKLSTVKSEESIENYRIKRKNEERLKKNKPIIPPVTFHMKKRTKFASISIASKHINSNFDSIYINFLGKFEDPKIKEILKQIKTNKRMFKLIKKETKFFISYPIKIEQKQTPKDKTIALDAGIHNFIAGFSNNKILYSNISSKTKVRPKFRTKHNINNNTMNKQELYLNKIDNIQSIIDTCKFHKKIRSLRKAKLKYYKKLKNLTKNLHRQTARYLCENYSHIIYPVPNVKSWQKSLKDNRLAKRKLQCLSHYKFKVILENKAEMYGTKILIVNEHYTTKTCTRCGNQYKIGLSRVYNCPKCCLLLDRDINGARNTLIRTLTKQFAQIHVKGLAQTE
jgi:IS605 OrfB family transposase